MQEELAIANKVAWETKAYQAWVNKYGTPDELAVELKARTQASSALLVKVYW